MRGADLEPRDPIGLDIAGKVKRLAVLVREKVLDWLTRGGLTYERTTGSVTGLGNPVQVQLPGVRQQPRRGDANAVYR